jgi:hypothetical protein
LCPYNKRRLGDKHIQREDDVKAGRIQPSASHKGQSGTYSFLVSLREN